MSISVDYIDWKYCSSYKLCLLFQETANLAKKEPWGQSRSLPLNLLSSFLRLVSMSFLKNTHKKILFSLVSMICFCLWIARMFIANFIRIDQVNLLLPPKNQFNLFINYLLNTSKLMNTIFHSIFSGTWLSCQNKWMINGYFSSELEIV